MKQNTIIKLNLKEASLKHGIPYETLRRKTGLASQLEYLEVEDKTYLVESAKNLAILKDISATAKKNSLSQQSIKNCVVDPKFYEVFTENEQIAIFMQLKRQSLMDLKWWYFYKGAKQWDEFYFASPQTKAVNTMIEQSESLLKPFIDGKKINIIDIGCGNGEPAIRFIRDNKLENRLNKYVAVDISRELVELTQERLNAVYPDIAVEEYVHDIEREAFDEALLRQQYEDPDSVNIILFLGHTINNQQDRLNVLRNIKSTMTSTDILLVTCSTNHSKNIVIDEYSVAEDPEEYEWVLTMLGIDLKLCKNVQEYDQDKGLKVNYIVTDKPYRIEFSSLGRKQYLDFHKGQKINIWSHYLIDREEFEQELKLTDLRLISFIAESDGKNMMFVCSGL